jgi:adenylate kinase
MKKYLFLFLLFSLQYLSSLEPTILLFGAPGSGKGTFSQYLKENYNYNHISAGDLIRNEIDKNTDIGRPLADIVRRGENVDPKIVQKLIRINVLECKKQGKPFIIDGFGRTDADMTFLHKLLVSMNLDKSSFILFFDAEDEVCKERISHRLLCSDCGHVYNELFNPPLTEGTCDLCSGCLKIRLNDTKEVIEKRILGYRQTVEKSYRKGFSLFPHILYNTSKPMNECLEFYSTLAVAIKAFPGSAAEFIKEINLSQDSKERATSY